MLNPNFIFTLRLILVIIAAIALTVIIVTNNQINKQIKKCRMPEQYHIKRIALMVSIIVFMVLGFALTFNLK